MKVYKKVFEWPTWGILVQEDMCYEGLGVWYPGWSVSVYIGCVMFVFSQNEEDEL